MGKLTKTSFLIIPIAVYLALFSGSHFEPESIRGQRVLVTGASSGIGEQLAYQYATMGAKLVITARRADLLQNVSSNCQNLGSPEVHFVAADMASPGDRSKVIEHVQKHLGGLDTLVLNHAILIEGWWTGSAQQLTLLEQVLHINFLSYVDIASKELPMLTTSRGRIGVVSSGFGEMGCVLGSMYTSSKFALHGFFSSFRQELRHNNSGVSVTLVVLGPVASDAMLQNIKNAPVVLIEAGSLATPAAAARAVLEGVAQRLYKIYFDLKMKAFRVLNALCPRYLEESFSRALMGDDGTWLSSLMLQSFGWVF